MKHHGRRSPETIAIYEDVVRVMQSAGTSIGGDSGWYDNWQLRWSLRQRWPRKYDRLESSRLSAVLGQMVGDKTLTVTRLGMHDLDYHRSSTTRVYRLSEATDGPDADVVSLGDFRSRKRAAS